MREEVLEGELDEERAERVRGRLRNLTFFLSSRDRDRDFDLATADLQLDMQNFGVILD